MLKELINEKWKEAFKARDMEKRTAYEMMKQKIMVAEKSGQFELPLTDEQITNLIIKEIKEREDVLQFYKPEDDASCQFHSEDSCVSECLVFNSGLEQLGKSPHRKSEYCREYEIWQSDKCCEAFPHRTEGWIVLAE